MKKTYLFLLVILALVMACGIVPTLGKVERTKDDNALVIYSGVTNAAILPVNTPIYIHTTPAPPTPGSWMYPINELKREGKP